MRAKEIANRQNLYVYTPSSGPSTSARLLVVDMEDAYFGNGTIVESNISSYPIGQYLKGWNMDYFKKVGDR